MNSDPAQDDREGPSSDFDPAESHSGEGLASVRPRLARTLADSALRSAGKQMDAMTSRIPAEPDPEHDANSAHRNEDPQEKSPAAAQRG